MPSRSAGKSWVALVAAAAGLSAAVGISSSRSESGRPPGETNAREEVRSTGAETERSVRERLQTKATVAYKKRPLQDVVDELATRAGVNWWIDRTALGDESIPLDTPLDVPELSNVTVETALEMILPDLGLAWYVQGDILRITTRTEEGDVSVTRVYDVRRLLRAMKVDPADGSRMFTQATLGLGMGLAWTQGPPPSPRAVPPEARRLVELIDPPFGSADAYGNLLAVRASPSHQEEIAALLDALTEVATAPPGVKPRIARPATYPFAEDEVVRQALDGRVSVEWREKPLGAALAELFENTGVRHRIDRNSFEAESIPLDVPVDLVQRNISRGTALELALEPLGLSAIVRHGFVVVATMLIAEEQFESVVYDVRDLVIDDDLQSLIGFIENEAPGHWWGDGLLVGWINALPPGLLVIRQTQESHAGIAELLAEMREKQAPNAEEKRDPDEIVTRQHQLPAFADAERIALAVREFVAPNSWEGADGSRLRAVGNVLVVRQSRKVQQQVEDFLRDLEATSARNWGWSGGGLGGLSGGGFFDVGRHEVPAVAPTIERSPRSRAK
ncbi:MAG: hypothetical protein WD066_02065 [Planctomycetaceae bacterium]